MTKKPAIVWQGPLHAMIMPPDHPPEPHYEEARNCSVWVRIVEDGQDYLIEGRVIDSQGAEGWVDVDHASRYFAYGRLRSTFIANMIAYKDAFETLYSALADNHPGKPLGAVVDLAGTKTTLERRLRGGK